MYAIRSYYAEQGVDYFTVHAGVLLRYIPMTALSQGAERVEMIALEIVGEMPLSKHELDMLLGSAVDRITSYNVCYTKLLRGAGGT